jgi:hypothetical protein
VPIVQAVGIAVGNISGDRDKQTRVEKAMHAALDKARAEGITDDDILRERIRQAREAEL